MGTMKGFDQSINVILDECHERVYSTNRGVEQVILGLYIIRGDNSNGWRAGRGVADCFDVQSAGFRAGQRVDDCFDMQSAGFRAG
ncbi:hypothetical protein HAZT_HAZT002221 [Hyalella azteca]|uniref:U6 snRNA-associated Sm-like protein LSm8 n=1 Tax=Hyalella azteca TaxID=294128 RepID=A0A6A0GR95_HYAAZ|nr:hypothetical protein HAZT_HAZT002221 [Hyalella azteca]